MKNVGNHGENVLEGKEWWKERERKAEGREEGRGK